MLLQQVNAVLAGPEQVVKFQVSLVVVTDRVVVDQGRRAEDVELGQE